MIHYKTGSIPWHGAADLSQDILSLCDQNAGLHLCCLHLEMVLFHCCSSPASLQADAPGIYIRRTPCCRDGQQERLLADWCYLHEEPHVDAGAKIIDVGQARNWRR